MKHDRFIHSYEYHLPQFRYTHAIAQPASDVPIELHEEHELCFFYHGNITFYIEGSAYSMAPGDILVIANTELHRAHIDSSAAYERVVIHFNTKYLTGFEPDDFDLLNFIMKRRIGHQNRIDSTLFDTSRVYSFVERMGEIIREGRVEQDLMMKTMFVELLVELRRTYDDNWGVIGTPTHKDKKIKDVLKFINENLHRKITLESLRKEFYISKYYLCHLFKQSTGFTVVEYLTNKRIMRAKQLLIEGAAVADACYAVGFGDYSNFYKVFKRATGKSPLQFAKGH